MVIDSIKSVRTRLGGYLVDLKYVDEKVFLIEKVGEDDFVGVLTSARFLRENGIDIPVKKVVEKATEKTEVTEGKLVAKNNSALSAAKKEKAMMAL